MVNFMFMQKIESKGLNHQVKIIDFGFANYIKNL